MKRTEIATLVAFGIAALTALGMTALLTDGIVSAGSDDLYLRIESKNR